MIAAAGATAHNLTFNTTGYLIRNNTLTLNGTTPTISLGTGTNGAAVTALANLGSSGSRLDAAPTVTGQNPTFNAAALNGRGTIHMTGTQGLQTANNLGIIGYADRSIFVVMARGSENTNATGSMFLHTGATSNNNAFGVGNCYDLLYLPYTWANDQTTTARRASSMILRVVRPRT